jgi:hypothetical protein
MIIKDRINGVPVNGEIAYKEGVLAGECPYMEEDPDFQRWNDEWDAAADDHEEHANDKPKVGSVVTNRYRALYSESGHPTHCGDALATLLNSICNNKAGTNLELFEKICAANGVDLTKYNRSSKGWQGRLRMTGRNLLAKRVAANHGKLYLPEEMGGEHRQLDEDWIYVTVNKYKPRSKHEQG